MMSEENWLPEALEVIEKAGLDVEEVRTFLHELRDSGEVNMFGSGSYLQEEYGFDRHDVKPIVLAYMRNGLGEHDG